MKKPRSMKQLLEDNAGYGRRNLSQVFRDFVELTAISMRNSFDTDGREVREERYATIVERYEAEELQRFAEVSALLVIELERSFGDVLGELYMSLDLGNERLGQFFTPYGVSQLTAAISIGDMTAALASKDFITVLEPSCGSGGMIIATAEALRDQGVNYQRSMHVMATDLDQTAVHMAYIQCTLLHIPALVVHGNTLTQERFDVWPTLAHALGFWDSKLAGHAAAPVTTITTEQPRTTGNGATEAPAA